MILSGPLVGLGRPGLLLRKQGGWLVLWCLACVVGAGVGLVAWCWHRRHARCCLVWWWWVPLLLGVACCRGSGAVRPGCLACLFCFPFLLGGGGGCGWVGCELYSGREHLTVRFLRQNIFLVLFVCFVVCFFERSVDALASGADEGRGGLRYSSGSRLAGCDPRVSEWGDPARVMSCHLHLNCIGCGG